MRLKWTKRALRQFNEAQDYIEEDNPVAAQTVAQRIASAIELLLSQPNMGHAGRIAHTQEWVVLKTSYVIAYTADDQVLTILRLIHSKQTWPPTQKH